MTQANQGPSSGQNFKVETQQERWFKYGGNVLLVCVVVVVLALVVIWLGQMFDHRTDTTTAGLYSLKPQTVSIIKNNKQPIKLVSLLTKTKQTGVREDRNTPEVDRIQPVIDLMEEYQDKGKNITYEVIDPATQPAKVEQLIEQVMDKYGGEVKKYREFIHDFLGETEKGKTAGSQTRPATTYDQLKAQVEELNGEMKKLVESAPDVSQEMYIMLSIASQTVQRFPEQMDDVKEGSSRLLKQQPPDLKGAVDAIDSGLQRLSTLLGPVIESFKSAEGDKKLDPKLKKFIDTTMPQFQKLKDAADAQIAKIKGLGDLKLDTVRETLKHGDAVLVMGETEMKAVPMDKIWQTPQDVRGYTPEGKTRPRFAGEQQITSAILSLTIKQKPKVCFIRPGGPPWTTAGFPPIQDARPFSEIASRLRDYNFDVVEKDLSGTWAMQAQMRQQFAPPEPSDDEIKDAIWVVIDLNPQQSPMGGAPTALAPKLADHLKGGGSALVLCPPREDALTEALSPFGITVDPQHLIVHEQVTGGPESSDPLEQALKEPAVFFLHDWGDHAITRPINGLEGIMIPMLPVKYEPKPGYTGAALIPVPQTLKVWGEGNLESLSGDKPIEYNPPKPGENNGDILGPFHVGAAVEKVNGPRLVVIGAFQFPMDRLLLWPDTTLAKQHIYAARFPANGELFMNSIFWLSRQDAMISISPMAMETPRIGDIPKNSLNFWRIGVLLVGLPGLVILAGIFMFAARRD